MAAKKLKRTPARKPHKVLMACRSCYKTHRIDQARVVEAPIMCPDCMAPLVLEQEF